ncbi:AraC family transcriptional regulator [Clostridium grantii]|uniref:AraC-like ligand binding domain-containing protein n=1 Tax=Clostridium grantii DSM 8605 TaxID=1121316 RepID=A0A1M5U2B7_9CLOT|nr:AraC family transcriptional regulator [Clostridium grantii]SHH57172.1 AraC-like ligand binding domain-containing protein [Clostridium grantii DSM 8605]
MEKNDSIFINNYLSNLNVNIYISKFVKCKFPWKEMNAVNQYNKLYYIRGGEGWIKIEDEIFYPQKNELIFIPQGITHSFSNISEDTFLKYYCHFTAKIGSYNLFDIIKFPFKIEVRETEEIENIFEKLVETSNSYKIASSIESKAFLMQLISYYIQNSNIKEIKISKTSTIDKMNKIITYINENIKKDLTISELSGIANLHPNYFTKLFSDLFGMSPVKYINSERMTKAKQFLTCSNMSILEIASNTGFKDAYYFSQIFKKYTQQSPTEYRKNYSLK